MTEDAYAAAMEEICRSEGHSPKLPPSYRKYVPPAAPARLSFAPLTPEQAAIMALLSRVEDLERQVKALAAKCEGPHT